MPETITPLWTADATVINLTAFDETKGRELIPKGTYVAMCDECTFGESNSGNRMVTFKFKLEDDENAEIHGRSLYLRCMVDMEWGARDLKKASLALNPELDMTKFNLDDVGEYFECRPCQLKVIQKKRKDTGEMGNEVREVLPAPGNSFWDR